MEKLIRMKYSIFKKEVTETILNRVLSTWATKSKFVDFENKKTSLEIIVEANTCQKTLR